MALARYLMICDTLGYKDGVPFTVSFGFLAFSYDDILHSGFQSRAVSVNVVGQDAVTKRRHRTENHV